MMQPKTAREIMVKKLVTLSPEKHVLDGIDQLLKHSITGAPVVNRQQEYLGVFSEKCCMNVLDVMAQSASEDENTPTPKIQARDFMATDLVTLAPESDAFDAISTLLSKRISGAPVVDAEGNFLGVFSEKDSMNVLISAAYDQLPSTRIAALMNPDQERIISADTDLFDVANIFLTTPLRRLCVVEDGKLLGQISRRDVLQTEKKFSRNAKHKLRTKAQEIASKSLESDANGDKQPHTIAYFMDTNAKTIEEDTDLLRIARIFLDTPYRRLPVLKDGQLVGQISRRDLLHAANSLFDSGKQPREKSLLYLSSLVDRQDAPEFGMR